MKISAIKKQVKNPERVSIMVDGRYGFSLSLDELLKYRLKNNQELSEAELKKFKQLSADGKLQARAREWLLVRPRSEREFRDYMYKKKAEPNFAQKLAEEFTDKGYLNDYKFGLWYAELMGRRSKSRRAINAELIKKGISREVRELVLGEATIDEKAALSGVVEKKLKLSRYKNDPQKLARYLTSQGFGWTEVKEALKLD